MFYLSTLVYSAAAAVGLAALGVTDDPPEAKPPAGVEAKAEAPKGQLDELRTLYEQLRKLRARPLADKPKEFSKDAAKLYREALEAAEAEDWAKVKARTDAARELARALELSLGEDAGDPQDPELPQPPRDSTRKVYVYSRVVQGGSTPPDAGNQAVKPFEKAETEEKAEIKLKDASGREHTIRLGNAEIRLYRSGDDPKREVFVKKLDIDGAKVSEEVRRAVEAAAAESGKGGPGRPEAARNSVEEAREAIRLQLSRRMKPDEEGVVEVEIGNDQLDTLKRAESIERLKERLSPDRDDAKVDGKAKVRLRLLEKREGQAERAAVVERLEKLRDTIEESRKEADQRKGAARYKEAVGDLYEAARRELQAERMGRAAELARAAEALAQVDRPAKTGDGETAEVRREGLFELRKSGEGEDRIDFELRKEEAGQRDDGGSKPRAEGDPDDAGPKVGVGVLLSFEDGRGQVTGLVPGGPAAEDGRIKAGDALLGIETESGAINGFADKDLPTVTKLIRGESGSKVKLLVRREGSGELKVIELARKKLELPRSGEEKADLDD